jgi:hypothetical protein
METTLGTLLGIAWRIQMRPNDIVRIMIQITGLEKVLYP